MSTMAGMCLTMVALVGRRMCAMVNFWEETAVDQAVVTDDGALDPTATFVRGYEGLGAILGRIKAGRASHEDLARVLVLAEEIEAEVSELAPLAGRLRALAAGGRDAVGVVVGGSLPGGGVSGVVGQLI